MPYTHCIQSYSALFVFFFPLDPRFIGVHLIPESDNPEDDKIFLFFKENAMDGEHTGKATIARIGQLCKVTTHTHNKTLHSFPLSNGKPYHSLHSLLSLIDISVYWCEGLQKCVDVFTEWYGRSQESGEQVDHFPQGPANVFSPRGQRHWHTLWWTT